MTRLAIERLGGEGDGLARHDGAVIAVPFTLPDEEVEGEVVEGTMPDARILRSSPHRVKAPCGQFRRCGGCSLQHADDATVAAWKRTQVVDALSKAGIIAPEAQVVTSPPRSRIRATLAGRRTKKGAQVGFHARASDQIVPAEGCVLVHPDLGAALPLLEALTRLLGSRKGEVTMALTRSQNGLDIDISGGRTPDAEMQATLAALMPPYKVARLTFSGDLIAQQEPPVQRLGKALVAPPPGAFLQATDEGRDALVAFARSELAGARRVADLFAGLGTFALPLAENAEVAAYESDPAMMDALGDAWRRTPGLKDMTTNTRDLFRRPLLADELKAFDAALLDPPRAGARAQVAELTQSRLHRIVHVSCNPATFARDAATLVAGGYRLEKLLVVDQFRWSAHVELASLFTRGV